MFLRRVTITGFKSFANKTVLDLEPGITAIVGPNGSGKSNLADAVRWAFGEQSKGRLRLGDREDVVFAGTAKRARGSYAEVVLLFDNEDGALPLELTEVQISRRLYRSGESDYRLAGRSVRLSDIQALLAQGGFGANTYAVIGQGMIDSFLLSSPAERKLLFDEAAGIRGPELAREGAVRKLDATAANLVRLRDISAELAPRLALLEQAVTAAQVQRQLELEVSDLRIALAAAQLHHWTKTLAGVTDKRRQLAARTHELRQREASLTVELQTLQATAAEAASEQARLQSSLAKLEQHRDGLALELAQSRAAEAEAERAAGGLRDLKAQLAEAQGELSKAESRAVDLEAEVATNSEASERALRAVEKASREVASAQAALVAIRKRGEDGTRDQYVDHALQILKTLAVNLSAKSSNLEEIKLLIHKAGRLLSHATHAGAAELLADLQTAQKRLEAAMAKRDIAIEHQTNVTITGRSLDIDLAHQLEATQRAQARAETLTGQLKPILTTSGELKTLEANSRRLATELAVATTSLEQQRDQIRALGLPGASASGQADAATALERARAATVATEGELARIAADLAEATTALATARAAATELGLSDDRPAPKASPAELEARLLRAEAQLEAHRGVQRDQAAEYESVRERTTTLSTQIEDLEVAQADLERVIAELDDVIRARFKTNFTELATQFSAYFGRLFEGGTASLELTETDDSSYGIVIKASPKGKRLTSLAALSGGERALAGVALLAAILKVNPSPFVVLDEIDAALDEANSGRLASILEELQAQSQLIVITHNRQTMHAARVLFGVTINEHHVSHLISMRLEDAAALAAR